MTTTAQPLAKTRKGREGPKMTVSIIGAGEVGRAYAKAIDEQGILDGEVDLCDPRPPLAAQELAAKTGIRIHAEPGTWLHDVDQVWLAVTGDLTLRVLEGLLPWLSRGTVVVDLTTASPADKRDAQERASAVGVRYVDAVILGAIALTGARTPLLAAGPHASKAMEPFMALGANVKCLPSASAGDAAALKLLRTILTKGLETLAVECLVAAEAQGVRAELYEAMSDVDDTGFTNFLDMLVRTHVVHAERRMHEVARAQQQLQNLGFPASMLAASEQVYARSVALREIDPPTSETERDVDEALRWLAKAERPSKRPATPL